MNQITIREIITYSSMNEVQYEQKRRMELIDKNIIQVLNEAHRIGDFYSKIS